MSHYLKPLFLLEKSEAIIKTKKGVGIIFKEPFFFFLDGLEDIFLVGGKIVTGTT